MSTGSTLASTRWSRSTPNVPRARVDETDTRPDASLAIGATRCHGGWRRLDKPRQRQHRAWTQFFKLWDLLLCPVSPVAAIRHDHREPASTRQLTINGVVRSCWDQVSCAGLPGAALLPATVAPVGRTSTGLPVGVQIVGPFLKDRTPIAFAAQPGQLIGGFEVPPGS